LLVGSEKKPFMVHKDVLCGASPFFETACKPEWLGDKWVIELPADEPDAINAMIYVSEVPRFSKAEFHWSRVS